MLTMRADICDPEDTDRLAHFRAILRAIKAELIEHHDSSLGVDLWEFRIGDATLNVFADPWSVDIEGPPTIVQRIIEQMTQFQTPTT
jgi:hypothetical protein